VIEALARAGDEWLEAGRFSDGDIVRWRDGDIRYAARVNLPFVREIPRHVRVVPRTSPQGRGPRLRVVLPTACVSVLLLALPLSGACFCGGPDAPTMETCSDVSTDWSGITGIEIAGAMFQRGFQGGSHFEFRIVPQGTNLPTCIAYQGTLEPVGGGTVPFTDLVRADGDGSRTIYIFDPPFSTMDGATLTVTALGFTETVATGAAIDGGGLDTGSLVLDVGDDDAGAMDVGDDASEDDAGEDDAGPEDAGDDDAG
jgi:hypothetical protein